SAHRSRTPSLTLGRRRHAKWRYSRRASPLRRHGKKLSFRSHQQDGREQPGGSLANRPNKGLALGWVERTRLLACANCQVRRSVRTRLRNWKLKDAHTDKDLIRWFHGRRLHSRH